MAPRATADALPTFHSLVRWAGEQLHASRVPDVETEGGRRGRSQLRDDATLPPLRDGTGPQRLSLYHRPGSVALLDDAPDYLEMLVASLPRHWNLEPFLSPQSFVNYLQQEPPRWEADFWNQQKIVEAWHRGTPLVPQVLDYWATTPERFSLTKVCVVDQLMPGMTGLQALDELVDWPGHRILLTGAFDEALATQAFNRGLIDQFIAKQTEKLASHLGSTIQMLMARPNARFHQIWAATLTPRQYAILRDPRVADDLARFTATTFVEWVVIGDPFGVLGISETGAPTWLQLEPTSGLAELAEWAADRGVDAEDVRHIQAGHCVYDRDLGLEMADANPLSVTPAFAIGDAGTLLAAIHRIDAAIAAPAALSYREWLAGKMRRRAGRKSLWA